MPILRAAWKYCLGSWSWAMCALLHECHAMLWWWNLRSAIGRVSPTGGFQPNSPRQTGLGTNWSLPSLAEPPNKRPLFWLGDHNHECEYWCFTRYRLSACTSCLSLGVWQGFSSTWISPYFACNWEQRRIAMIDRAPAWQHQMPEERICAGCGYHALA